MSAIKQACNEILTGSIKQAKQIISDQYPFIPISYSTRYYSNYQKIRIFLRDEFIDRYSGDKLVFPAVLRLLSRLMPKEFPFHKNWKRSKCHFAYWQFLPTVDHIIPISRGRLNCESNWVCTSQLRNSAKSNWLLDELRWKLHDPGKIEDWDGMIHFFMEYVQKHLDILKEDKYLNSWYQAVVKVI